MRGHWFALQANQWFFMKRKQKKIELVARPPFVCGSVFRQSPHLCRQFWKSPPPSPHPHFCPDHSCWPRRRKQWVPGHWAPSTTRDWWGKGVANDSEFFLFAISWDCPLHLALCFEKLKGQPWKITQAEVELCFKTQGNSAYRGEVLQKLIINCKYVLTLL